VYPGIEKGGNMRKVILTAAICSLVLLNTQAATFLHLVCEQDHGKHDSQNCPVCQQLFKLASNLAIEAPVEIFQLAYRQRVPDFKEDFIPVVFIFQTSKPRAPPLSPDTA
jgi:hypothetical protein